MSSSTASRDVEAAHAEASDPRVLGRWQVIAGTLGLIAAFVLVLEKIATLKDPSYIPSCSINPVLSCGSVMASPQAEALGFPNPLVGLIAFPLVIVTGALNWARVPLPRWYSIAFAAGTVAGAAIVHWLIWVSLYRVHALCPYCMVVWIVVIPVCWYTALHTFRFLAPLRRLHTVVLALWFVLIATLVFLEFRTYWLSLV